jgi:hypothetical protein
MTSNSLNQSRLQWYATNGAFLVSLIFLTNWPSYQFLMLGGPIALFYYLIPSLIIVPLVWLRPDTLRRFMSESSLHWFLFYMISGLLWLMIAQGYLEAENRQWRLRFLSFFFFCTGLILTAEAEHHKVARIIAACAVLAAITYWLDFLFPFNFVPLGFEFANPGRGAGLFLNANSAAYALIVMCIAAMPFIDMRFRPAIFIIMVAGVIATFSRSAIIFSFVVFSSWIYFNQLKRRSLIILSISLPVVLFIGFGLFQFGLDAEGANLANLTERLNFFESAGEERYDFSAEERKHVADMAWEMFTNSPFFGEGIGSTVTWGATGSTHNMYLLLLADQGVFGGLLYLSFLSIIIFRGIRLLRQGVGQQDKDIGLALTLLGIYYTLIGFFSHNLLDDPHTLFLLAFLFTAELKASRLVRHRSERERYA